jgi:hypothetical protein
VRKIDGAKNTSGVGFGGKIPMLMLALAYSIAAAIMLLVRSLRLTE